MHLLSHRGYTYMLFWWKHLYILRWLIFLFLPTKCILTLILSSSWICLHLRIPQSVRKKTLRPFCRGMNHSCKFPGVTRKTFSKEGISSFRTSRSQYVRHITPKRDLLFLRRHLCLLCFCSVRFESLHHQVPTYFKDHLNLFLDQKRSVDINMPTTDTHLFSWPECSHDIKIFNVKTRGPTWAYQRHVESQHVSFLNCDPTSIYTEMMSHIPYHGISSSSTSN